MKEMTPALLFLLGVGLVVTGFALLPDETLSEHIDARLLLPLGAYLLGRYE